jgi:hypothetical protein
MAISQVRARIPFRFALDGRDIDTEIEILNSWRCSLRFGYRDDEYELLVASNDSQLKKTMTAFITETSVQAYGYVDRTVQPVRLIATTAQRDAFLQMLARDICECFNAIVLASGRNVMDYAVWYRCGLASQGANEFVPGYKDMVHEIACHFIVHNNFIGNAKFDVAAWGAAYEKY